MTTTSIRVDRSTQQKLKDIARRKNTSIGAVVDDFITSYERQEFRKHMQDDFTRLRKDPVAWEAYKREFAAWDVTLADGFENEPPYYDNDEAVNG